MNTRYRSEKDIRNAPKDDLEVEFQHSEISAAADKIMGRFDTERPFFKSVVLELAKRQLGDKPRRNDLGQYAEAE